ncbi:MAG: hypothetical protein CL811_06315 [Colwelliaceae bacterium]|jgi:hypothetical protein|nr:hypothetical protein [Colwelliaceae bacterium]|tara:strand:+ start:9366 stop:9698 length:333 start_codon:yes stop_codon:yes gene_type:complete
MSEDRSEYNDWRDWENIEFTTASTADITINVNASGAETATVKNLNKGSLGSGITLRPDSAVTVVQVNNKVFRDPITVSTAGMSISKHMKDLHTIVIRPTVAVTLIKLLIT